MDEEKKTLGRAKIYSGEPENQINSRAQSASAGDRRSRRAEPIDTKPKEHLAMEPGRRRKDIETDAKMRRLWALLGVLVVILVAAIVYEIVLGHASTETGSQRMNQAAQETEQAKETEQVAATEQDGETEQTGETEQESETVSVGSSTDAAAVSGDGTSANTGSSDESTVDADISGQDGSTADSDAADGLTLAGLDD